MLSSMVRLLTKNMCSTKLWSYKKMKTTLQICQKFSNSGRTYFSRKTPSLSFLGSQVRKNSLCFFIATLWNESYSNFALSAILELILLSVHKLPASFLNLRETVLLLCTIFCWSREDTTLTRLNWSGDLSSNLMRILMIICLHSYRNNWQPAQRQEQLSYLLQCQPDQVQADFFNLATISHSACWQLIVHCQWIFFKKSGQPASWR